MKKYIFMFALVLILFPLSAHAAHGSGAVDASDLNVRSAPSTDAAVIGMLDRGETVNILTKTGGAWFKIEYEGKIGYVNSIYIKDSRTDAPKVGPPSETEPGTEPIVPPVSTNGQLVVETAKKYLGVPYVYGGSSPSGFDCSGLVQYVFKELGVSINRVAADQTAHGTPVSKENLQPGDVVFFHNTARYSTINHVGIYVGDGNFIHAPQTGEVVKFTTLESGYYARTFVAARRILE